jgi:hypothetical protein
VVAAVKITISQDNIRRGMEPVTNRELLTRLVDAVRCPHCDSTHEVHTPVANVFGANVTTLHAKGCPVKDAIKKFNVRAQKHLYLTGAQDRTREVYQWMTRNNINPHLAEETAA